MFDIKTLFVANHPELAQRHPLLTSFIVKTAAFLWNEKKFKAFAGEHADLKGGAFIARAFESINFAFVVSDEDISKVPKTGRLVIVANHPMGNLDGIGLLQVLSTVRPDIKLLVSGALHKMLGMQDLTIPIDNVAQSISKDSLKTIKEHLDQEGAIIVFPTRLYADCRNGRTIDDVWKGSFFKFALEKNAPILPIYIGGRNSYFYYLMVRICVRFFSKQLWTRELIQMKMMREIFSRHANSRIPMRVGDLVSAQEIDRQYSSTQEKINAVRTRLYELEKSL